MLYPGYRFQIDGVAGVSLRSDLIVEPPTFELATRGLNLAFKTPVTITVLGIDYDGRETVIETRTAGAR